jgi:hypothetical protein
MRVGAENRTKLVAACVLFVVAIIMLLRLFAGGSPPASAATAVAAPRPEAPRIDARARRGARPAAAANHAGAISLDPRLRLDLLKQSEDTEYTGAGRNIFRAEAEPVIPKPVANGTRQATNTPPPRAPGPPPPPPINLKFFGFASEPGEPSKVFLSHGDDIFVAAEGDIVNRRYKILHIGPKSVEIEDVLSNNRQTIPLTQG